MVNFIPNHFSDLKNKAEGWFFNVFRDVLVDFPSGIFDKWKIKLGGDPKCY